MSLKERTQENQPRARSNKQQMAAGYKAKNRRAVHKKRPYEYKLEMDPSMPGECIAQVSWSTQDGLLPQVFLTTYSNSSKESQVGFTLFNIQVLSNESPSNKAVVKSIHVLVT